MNNYRETLSQVMNQLKDSGYQHNIPTENIHQLKPAEWNLDSIHRFEGETNPADSSILYAISKKDGTAKTLIVNAYGMDAEKEVNSFISQLEPLK